MSEKSVSGSTSNNEVNPYAVTILNSDLSTISTNPNRLSIPGWIAVSCCVASMGFWFLVLVVSLPDGRSHAPPLFKILLFIGMFAVIPAFSLVGAISTLQRKRYGLAFIGAIGLLLPIFGPCFGLTLPIGVWLLVLLRRQSIRDAFTVSPNKQTGELREYDNTEDALTAAFQLNQRGEWDEAIELYRTVAARWPAQATYAENCIVEIMKKQTLHIQR